MKVYIVLMESGTIYSVRKSKNDAEKDKALLATMYEHAIIREYDVH